MKKYIALYRKQTKKRKIIILILLVLLLIIFIFTIKQNKVSTQLGKLLKSEKKTKMK